MTIKCDSCGKRYDYYKEESCPHCGAYNAPADGRTHACTSYELDHQGEEEEIRHRMPTQSQGESSWKKGAGSGQNDGWKFSFPSTGHSSGGEQQRPWEAQDPSNRSGRRRLWPAILIFLIALGFLLTSLISNLTGGRVFSPTPAYRPGNEEAAVFLPYPDDDQMYIYPIHTYAPGEEVSFSGITAITKTPIYADCFVAGNQPMSLVVLPLLLTVADQDMALSVPAPQAYLYYNPDSDEFVSPLAYDDFPQLFEAMGMEPIDFYTVAVGQIGVEQQEALFFMVPAQWTPGSLRLVLDEYSDAWDYTIINSHEITFEVTEENHMTFSDSSL